MITTKREHDSRRLHRFLARRPGHAAGFLPGFLREREELLARRDSQATTAAATRPASTISTRSTSAMSAK